MYAFIFKLLDYVFAMKGLDSFGLFNGVLRHTAGNTIRDRDKTLLFRRKNIVKSALYVNKKWPPVYGALGTWYSRKGFVTGPSLLFNLPLSD